MRDYQQELEQLREKIAQRREDCAVLERLRQQEASRRQITEIRQAEWMKEQRDVERMERVSLSSIFAMLKGSREEDLDREKAESCAAQLKLQEAERQLEEIRSEISEREKRIRANADCEIQYEKLLREKEREYREKDSALAEKLKELEQEKLRFTSQRKELQEAVAAGETAMRQLQAAIEQLESARGWSTWDMLGGGFVSDMIKYSRMDDAQRLMEGAQSALRRYQAELADVAVAASFEIQPDGFTSAIDVFFDNIFTDFAVRDRIVQSLERLIRIEDRVQQTQYRLEDDLRETERSLSALQSQWQELICQA